MTRGTVDVKLRPIKLAFLVNPNDKESLLKAIEINTFLWGGMYNPIIPTYKRIPSRWKVDLSKNLSAQSVISGYLDNFDPDYVVPMGKCVDYTHDIGYWEQINDVSEVIGNRYNNLKYGIGLFEIFNYFFEEELKFQQKDPPDICIPCFGDNFRPFLASVFGKFPENIEKIFWRDFAEPLEARKVSCSALNYAELFDSRKLFLRRMTGLYIRPRRYRRRRCIFFLDATCSLDIMDYWNLRAVGWDVLPIPSQFVQSDEKKQIILGLIGKSTFSNHTVLRSRSISKSEYIHFLDSLGESRVKDQIRYPRIWDEWAQDNDYVECCELEVDTTKHDVSTDGRTIRFETLDPNFATRYGRIGRLPFANEIQLRLYDEKELFAEVIPRENKKFGDVTGGIVGRNWRVSRKGLVYLSGSSKRTVNLPLPQAETTFIRWLRSSGWTVELSSAGHIAKQIVKQLGGVRGAGILALEGIVQLLGEMNDSTGRSMLEKTLRGRIAKIANQAGYKEKESAEGVLQRLIEAKICQLGIEIQCPLCTQFSWHSIKGVDYELQCPKCLEEFLFPSASKQVKWSYRTLGPFSLPKQAHGAYTVLLTLRFFSYLLSFASGTTPLMSFTARRGKTLVEADLALFFQISKFRPTKTEVIFVECKTFNSFQRKDVNRMVNLGKAFPGAILVFATLKKSLNRKEKNILSPMVNRSRKHRKNDTPFNPILILTGTELFWRSSLSEWWEKIGNVSELEDPRNLLELCDVTQQVYLDMEPAWDQDLENDSET